MNTILLVDDEEHILDFLDEFITDSLEGIKILRASNGKEAIDVIKKNPNLKLVISDYYMPELDGKKLFDYIKSTKPNLGLIWVSGNSSTELLRDVHRMGAYDVYEKPFSLTHIKDSIQTYFAFTHQIKIKEKKNVA